MKRKYVLLLVLATPLFTSLALAQQNVPPPPKPADDGSSIAGLMKNIKDLLDSSLVQRITVQYVPSDSSQARTSAYTLAYTQVALDPQTCDFRYHLSVATDGNLSKDSGFDVPLRALTYSGVDVSPEVDTFPNVWPNASIFPGAVSVNPYYAVTVSPAVFDVNLLSSSGPHELLVADEQHANRLASELVHAITLCAAESTRLPGPSDGTPTLAETMKVIQEKLHEQGSLQFTETRPGWHYRDPDVPDEPPTRYSHSYNLLGVVADPRSCRITVHSKTLVQWTNSLGSLRQVDGTWTPGPSVQKSTTTDEYINASLRDVKKISVQSWDDAFKEVGITTMPQEFTINVSLGLKRHFPIFMEDEDLANRVARALNHAAEVCTPDGTPDPF
jgi:hypothetical protein